MSVHLGVAEDAARTARDRARQRLRDREEPILVGGLENRLVTARLAVDDMIRLANRLDFHPSAELASSVLVRKTIAANSDSSASRQATAAFTGRLALELDPVETRQENAPRAAAESSRRLALKPHGSLLRTNTYSR